MRENVKTCKRENVGVAGPRGVFTFSRFHVFTPPRGFTLIEMLVALAVLVVALGIVTSVFSITTTTASQSAATVEMQSLARNVLYQIGEDLKFCNPAQSVLVIAGRTQQAALTEAERAANVRFRVLTGNPTLVPANYDPRYATALDFPYPNNNYSDPRADIFAFVTERLCASAAPPTSPSTALQNNYAEGGRFAPNLVVYGHASVDSLAPGASGGYAFAGSPISIDANGISRLPLNRWHLARRLTILEPSATAQTSFQGSNGLGSPAGANSWLLRCEPNAFRAGDVAGFDLSQFFNNTLQAYNLGRYAGSNPPASVRNILYANGQEANHHIATIVERPPTDLRYNLGVQFAPGCVWFQVEFLMPEDPRNGLEHPDASQRDDMPRWVEVPPGDTYVFLPDSAANRQAILANGVNAAGQVNAGTRLADFAEVRSSANMGGNANSPENRAVRLWPYAVRITIRLIDPKGRLNEPLVRSLVHRFD
ncbi:MAG: prepilin-type N-terminal cleavage/methylation domain-containing protein [Phycisphaerae bacterium]